MWESASDSDDGGPWALVGQEVFFLGGATDGSPTLGVSRTEGLPSTSPRLMAPRFAVCLSKEGPPFLSKLCVADRVLDTCKIALIRSAVNEILPVV